VKDVPDPEHKYALLGWPYYSASGRFSLWQAVPGHLQFHPSGSRTADFRGHPGVANGITFVIWIGCIVHAWFTVHGRNQAVREQKSADAFNQKE
jgi:hypothetical protein